MRRLSPYLLVAVLAAASPGVSAQPEWLAIEQRPGAESALLDRGRSLSSERRDHLQAEEYPSVELLRRTEVELRSDGTIVDREVLVRHLLNDAGVREHGNLVRYVRSEVERIIVEEAWVLLARGDVIDLDPASIQVLSDDVEDLFSDVQKLVFAFGNLEPGATIVLVTRTEARLQDWPLSWTRIYYPQLLVPTERFEVEVSWQPGQRAPRWTTDDPRLACSELGGKLKCSRDLVAPAPFDQHVAWGDRLPHLVVGEAHEWKDLVDRERDLVMESARPNEEIESLAASLGLQDGSKRERMEKAHRFVADRIRYVGFEHGQRAVVPRAASETLRLRYGDCKDKVALFVALARSAGLDAYPALVGTGRYDRDKLLQPSWRYFDHMIACIGKGKPVCVDLTDPYSRTGRLPLGVDGTVALSLRDGVEGPQVLPERAFGWDIRIEGLHEMDCEGKLEEEVVRRFRGLGAARLRGHLHGKSAADRKRWILDDFREVTGAEAEADVGFFGLSVDEDALGLSTKVTHPASAPVDSYSSWYQASHWLNHYGGSFRTENAHHPYRSNGLRVLVRSTFRVCSRMRTRFMGAELDFRSRFGTLRRKYDRNGEQEVVVRTELDLPAREIPVAEIDDFNGFLEASLGETNVWFSIEPASGSQSP